MKFKKGDTVRVISNMSTHGFKIGELLTIKSVNNKDYLAYRDGDCWYIYDDECEPVNNTVKLKIKQL